MIRNSSVTYNNFFSSLSFRQLIQYKVNTLDLSQQHQFIKYSSTYLLLYKCQQKVKQIDKQKIQYCSTFQTNSNINMKTSRIRIIILILTLFWTSLSQKSVNGNDGKKIIKLLFSEVNDSEVQSQQIGSNMITYENFMAQMRENPISLLQQKNLYISGWPQPVKNTEPKNPLPNKSENVQTASLSPILKPGPTSDKNTSQPSEKITITTTLQTQQISSNSLSKQSQDILNQQLLSLLPASLQPMFSRSPTPKPQLVISAPNVQQKISGIPILQNQKTITNNTKIIENVKLDKIEATPNISTKILADNGQRDTASFMGEEPPFGAPIDTLRQFMLKLTNNLRARNNAGNLVINELFNKIAQMHSDDMVARGFFDHVNPDGERVNDRAKKYGYNGSIGQNLATARSLVTAQIGFENSPNHFTNAINKEWEQVGIGIKFSGSQMFITLVFGPRNISSNKLSQPQIAAYKKQLISGIISQSPSLKSQSPKLSKLIQEWLQSNRSVGVLQYVTSNGGYRVPLTAAMQKVSNAFTIPAKSEFGFQIIFRPLLAKQENSKITIKSPDLGEFAYPLKLIGQPSNSDRVMNFKAALGGQITQKLKFIHFGKKASVYTCRVEKIGQKTQQQVDPKAKVPAVVSDFTVETPTINVPGSENFEGVEGSVNVKFEPSGMGDSISQLIISSPDGGQYVTTLNGVSTAPQPKGPYKISAKPPPIDFKNPFFEAYQFVVRIDNPAFTSTVKSPVKVDGKKVLSINLAYKAVQGFSANGRLTISAGQNLTWVFYLQGE